MLTDVKLSSMVQYDTVATISGLHSDRSLVLKHLLS